MKRKNIEGLLAHTFELYDDNIWHEEQRENLNMVIDCLMKFAEINHEEFTKQYYWED
jgi:hypothetical protein